MEIKTVANYDYVKVFKIGKNEIDRIEFALCKQPVETLESFYDRQPIKPDILCNGGFFGLSNGNTYFTYRDDNKTVSYMDKYSEGFGVTANLGLLKAGNYGKDGLDYKDFICGYPVLIKNGKPYTSDVGKEVDYKTRRTVLAYDDNYIFVVIVDSPGLNFAQLKSVLTDLKVKEAINLDGGGSTRLLYNGKLQTSNSYASRAVDNVLALYFKHAQTLSTEKTNMAINPSILRFGDSGASVQALQYCLKGWGFDCGVVDGIFGKKTKAALINFQTVFDLKVDGIAGQETWKTITGSR